MLSRSKKINILFVSHLGTTGGAEKSLLDLISRLDTCKFNIFVNIPYRGPMSDAFDEADISYFISHTGCWITSNKDSRFRNARKFFSTLRARIWALEEKIERLNIDIVYSNSVSCIDGAIAAQRMGTPHIWHLREKTGPDTVLRSFLPLPLIRAVLRKIKTSYIATSSSVAQQLVPCSAYTVVANGVDTDIFSPEYSRALHHELNLDQSTIIIAIIGAVIPAKGISIYVEAALQLLEGSASLLHFVIVGDGDKDYIDQLKQLISAHDRSEKFSFMGQRCDIPSILRSSDMVIVASYSEGFSRVVIEGMAAAKPLVSTRCGGPESIINDGITGLLIPKGDPGALSAKIQHLVDHPKLAAEIGKKARQHVIDHFSLARHIEQIEGLITAFHAESIEND
jgi:glycosyltransferase involved in cell wall biosynthesis